VDDSWVTRIRAEHPDLTDEMIAANPLRHVLTNVIGANADTPVQVDERTLQDGELLLCADGVYGPLEGGALEGSWPTRPTCPAWPSGMLTAAPRMGSHAGREARRGHCGRL
jgi:hypothetical protein